MGHNLGADHIKSDGYIMSSRGSYNEVIFHPVTIEVIQKNLDYVRKTYNCFTSDVIETFSACGNGIKEGEEECDCGMSYGTCQDPCCYPSNISSADLTLNASATPCRRHLQPRCFQQYRLEFNIGKWIF